MIYIDEIPYEKSDNEYIRGAIKKHLKDWNLTIQTSGSTGTPKTVYHEESLVKKISEFNAEWFGLKTNSRLFSLYNPRGIAFTTMSLYPAVLSGCDLFIETNTSKYIDKINKLRPTHTCVLPNLYRVLSKHRKWKDIDFSSCEHLIMGGDYSPQGAIKDLKSKGAKQVYNVYGATEVPPSAFWSTSGDYYSNFCSNRMVDWRIINDEVHMKYKQQKDWFESGDLAKEYDNGFALIGRKHNMFKLGSCGVRIYPEQVEKHVVECGAELALCREVSNRCVIYYTGKLERQVDLSVKHSLVNVKELKVDDNLRKIDRSQEIVC